LRIRTILAAAAAPAALAAVLLGTAGQASAAVAAPQAALTASVVQQQKVFAVTHESGVLDTTGVDTGSYVDANGQLTKDLSQSVYGSTWARDDVERQLTATQNAKDGGWDVTLRTVGTYHAFANPLDGTAWNGSGRIDSTSTWHVDSGTPNKAFLAGQTDPTLRSQNIVAQFFGLDPNSSAVHGALPGSTWDYYGILGANSNGVPGLYEQTA
jgi:hypothetical protein